MSLEENNITNNSAGGNSRAAVNVPIIPGGGNINIVKPAYTSNLPLTVGSSAQALPVEIDRVSPAVKLSYGIDDPLGGTMYPVHEMANQKVLANYALNTYAYTKF